MTTLSIEPDLYDSVSRHMQSDAERVAFMRSRWDGSNLHLVAIELLQDQDLERSLYEVVLRDEVRARLIRWAWDAGSALTEAHSHGGPMPACFSPTDIDGLKDWVPHVRWRLRGQPYAALVFNDRSFDALLWRDNSEPVVPEALMVGGSPLIPTGQSIRHWGTA